MTTTKSDYEEIIELTEYRLEEHFKNNDFMMAFWNINKFYIRKFSEIITKVDEREGFENDFFELLKSQYHNGYVIGRELIGLEGFNIDRELYSSMGHLRSHIPTWIKDATGENYEEAIMTEIAQKVVSGYIQRYEGIYPLLWEAAVDIVSLGAYQAFLDEKESAGIKALEENQGFLADINDLYFVDHQRYLTCFIKNDTTEVWEMMYWSVSKAELKAGEVTIIKVPHIEEQSVEDDYYIKVEGVQDILDEELSEIASLVKDRVQKATNCPVDRLKGIITRVEGYYTL